MPGPGCPLLSPASVVSSVFRFACLPPNPVPSRGLPALLSFLPTTPHLDLGSGPRPLPESGLGSSERSWGLSPGREVGRDSRETLALGLWPMRRGTHRDPGRKGRGPTASWWVSHFSLLIPKTSSLSTLQGGGGTRSLCPVVQRAFPLSPRAPCRVSHQQDPFGGL
ncbi:hypothetical protein HJG60_008182 [Phyllostomus discolor]|uniref:Uncharacterized protein n=1 Tax=Phyllostomus discolor TaxID=89673 RepID=A0A834DLW8_9CHIR|nr:hypothetical protein HJG60_008182 [Phyllostomus discolor]